MDHNTSRKECVTLVDAWGACVFKSLSRTITCAGERTVPNDFFSSTDIREEAKIPSVEGCEIKVAREVPESWSGVKKGSAPTIEMDLS